MQSQLGVKHTKRHVRRSWLGFLWGLLVANAALLAVCAFAQNAAPSKDLHVTTRADGVLIYGRNAFGIQSVRMFPNWDETLGYLDEHSLRLPELSYAERGGTEQISMEPTGRAYKLRWVSQGHPKVLYAPDEHSARAFASYIRFRDLSPSYLGFSLVLTN